MSNGAGIAESAVDGVMWFAQENSRAAAIEAIAACDTEEKLIEMVERLLQMAEHEYRQSMHLCERLRVAAGEIGWEVRQHNRCHAELAPLEAILHACAEWLNDFEKGVPTPLLQLAEKL